MPKTLSNDDLWKYSDEHVTYEVERFFWLAGLLADPLMPLSAPSMEDVRRLNHALIEAFALHLRNLLEFLYENKVGDHIIAAQFCDPGVWKRERGAKTPTLKNAWGRANTEIAHLTDKRKFGYPPEKEWPVKKIADEIKPLIQRLSAKALPSRLSPKVVEAIDIKPEKMSGNKFVGIGPMAKPEIQGTFFRSITGPAGPPPEDEDAPKWRK